MLELESKSDLKTLCVFDRACHQREDGWEVAEQLLGYPELVREMTRFTAAGGK